MATAESAGAIYYTVDAQTGKLLDSTEQVEAALDKTSKAFAKTDKAAAATQAQMTQTAAATKEMVRQVEAAQNPLGNLSKLLGGLVTLQGASALIQMAESYGAMAERVQMATKTQEEYELVQQRLLATSNGTYRALSESQEIFIATSENLRDLGYTLEQALDVTDSLSYSFVANATATDRAQNALRAYDMALNKGKLEADGWITVIGAIPTIAADIAAATGKTAQEIRELGASGKLTAAMLNEGLRTSLEKNKAAADGMAVSIKDAFVATRNNIAAYVGEANRASGSTETMAKAIMLLGNNVETVANALLALGAGAMAKYLVTLTAATLASGRAAVAARAQAAENLRVAQANLAAAAAAEAHAAANVGLIAGLTSQASAARATAAAQAQLATAQTAARAAGAGLMGILGGPAGIVALLATAAVGIYAFGSKSEQAAPKVDQLTESIDKLTAAQLEQRKMQAASAVEKLTQEAISANGAVKALEKDFAALNAQFKSGKGGITAEGIKNVERALVDARAESDGATKSLQAMIDAEAKLSKAQQARAAKPALGAPKPQQDPEVKKQLENMREQLELTKLEGAARARLQALQKLGANATAEERAEAEKLATQIYNIENARKAGLKTAKEAASAAEKQEKKANEYINALVRQSLEVKKMTAQDKLRQDIADGTVVLIGKQLDLAKAAAEAADTRQNMVAFKEMGQALAEASLEGDELAKAKARAELNSFASPEEIALIEQMAVSLERVKAARGADPAATAKTQYEADLQALKTANEMKLIEDARYLELRNQLEYQYEEQRRAAQEETFRQQSMHNQMLMDSLDAVGSVGTSAITGILTRTMSLGDAVRSVGNAVLNSLVSSLVEVGIQQVKTMVMGQTAQAAATAASVAAGATTAAAWAPAAALVSLASFGANAAPASAGIASTVGLAQAMSIAGGRKYGGPAAAGGMYRINETGAPEVFNAANGQQYMLPNTRGEVVSNADATAQAGTMQQAPIVNITLVENAERGGQVEQTDDGVAIFVADIRGGGDRAQALEQTYGLQRMGT